MPDYRKVDYTASYERKGYITLPTDFKFHQTNIDTLSGYVIVIKDTFNLNSDTIKIPKYTTGTILHFESGQLYNGSISSSNIYYVDGSYQHGLKLLDNIYYAIPFGENNLILDVTDLPLTLAKYNLIPNDLSMGHENSLNFENIFDNSWFQRLSQLKKVTLLFPAYVKGGVAVNVFSFSNIQVNDLTFRPIKIKNKRFDINIMLGADIKANMSTVTLKEPYDENSIENQNFSVEDHSLFYFLNCNSLTIIGTSKLKTSQYEKTNRSIIDGSWDDLNNTFNGNYYEGFTLNNINYNSSATQFIFKIHYCGHAVLKNLHFTNSIHGTSVIANNVEIINCEASKSIGDNGITVGGWHETLLPEDSKIYIRDCYFHDCDDLGLSIQGNSAMYF
ncbi:hypothetical protein NBRC110019_12020 [Neptunitalea chrysea]|uniref:Right handed beta helix domain-containing protein n=1 Tax=Neptunitalea chrysea TaxID=1647581 RepID=A0A9W6EVY7_9FLAO|nr:hypothetical protein [Neptunitalea chrysea]GLB52163.1 hypothetical protein NBRC110019_12020 [Neptunitalea chrysea]